MPHSSGRYPYRPSGPQPNDPDPHDPQPHDPDPYNEYPGEPPVEPIAVAPCNANFVNGVSPNKDCVPRRRRINSDVAGTLKIVTFPGSSWTTAAGGPAAQQAIIQNAVNFYDNYCINLVPMNVAIPAATGARMAAWYGGWFGRVVAAIGGANKLGTTTIPTRLVNEFVREMRSLHTAAGNGLVVVFIDEYVSDTGAPVSANMQGFHQVGINFIDSGSPKILIHELVHALGKKAAGTVGAVTWNHESRCQNAISTIPRTDPRKVEPLAGMRFLDIAEFREIARNKAAGVLS